MRISIFGAFSAGKKCALYTGKYGIHMASCLADIHSTIRAVPIIYNTQHHTCYFKWPTKELPWWHEHYLCPKISSKCPSAYERTVFRAATTLYEDY